jgi:hypothetical protein
MRLLLNSLRCLRYARSGGVSRVAKGADCKSAALWLRRFESCLPHHMKCDPSILLKSLENFDHSREGAGHGRKSILISIRITKLQEYLYCFDF